MALTTRGRRQVTTSLFPGNYWVFRNLSLRVSDGGVSGNQLPFRVLSEILPIITEQLQNYVSQYSSWSRFQNVNENRIALIEPSKITTEISPTTWWCSDCHSLFSGPIGQIGIHQGICPSCNHRRIVQLAVVFMCPTCHEIEPIERVICPECKDSRSVVLEGHGGRRREYRWRCRKHPKFEVYLRKQCRRDKSRMSLKSTGGRLYNVAKLSTVHVSDSRSASDREMGHLRFSLSRASVVDVTIGRIPIADFNAFYQGSEHSPVEPFINPETGNFIGLVSRLETDAIIVTTSEKEYQDELTLHSIKHALMNAAPAVTGLTQDEFGAELQLDQARIILFDNVSGGTGGCRLLADRRLTRWLQVARELAECHQVQCDDACRACLFLPSRICSQGNHSLDRHRVLDIIPENLTG